MRRRRSKIWCFLFGAILTTLLAFSVAGVHADTSPRRFLVIYEHHSSLIANIEIAQGIEERLSEAVPTEREIYSVYLDGARFPGNPQSEHFLGLLEKNFAGMTFDAVLAIGPAALTFALEHRDDLAPEAPIGSCQTDSNQSQFPADSVNLPGTKLAPLGESGGAVELEILSRVEVALRIEMIVH